MFKTHTTTSLCAAAALLAGMAQADIIVPFGAPEFSGKQAKAFSGSVGVGYDTKYISRGMALQESDSDHVIPMELLAQYKLNDQNAIIGGISYTRFITNNWTLSNPAYMSDEGTGLIEFAHHFTKNTVVAAGYQFVHGGIPGSFNYHGNGDVRDFPMFDSNRSEEHSFVVDFHHDFGKGLEGLFWDTRVQYAFRWTDGWWFTNTLGYKHELTKKADLVVSATWHSSYHYFDSHTANTNGTQGYSFQLSVPTMVTEHVRITPHVGLNLIGNGAEAANDRAGADIYRDVTFVAGVGASYVF